MTEIKIHCNQCHTKQAYECFINEKGKQVTACQKCRNKRKKTSIQVPEQVQDQEYNLKCQSAITFEDISEFVYNSLISLEGTNEQYE
ncbi:9165_t:CDS:1, partial [Racocetra fulgida]